MSTTTTAPRLSQIQAAELAKNLRGLASALEREMHRGPKWVPWVECFRQIDHPNWTIRQYEAIQMKDGAVLRARMKNEINQFLRPLADKVDAKRRIEVSDQARLEVLRNTAEVAFTEIPI